MFLWRWDDVEDVWRTVALKRGESVMLGPRASLLAAATGVCALFVDGRVAVNGVPALPIRILRDRDEIRIDGQVVYVSVDGPAEIVPFSGGPSVRCGRCQGLLQPGAPAVQCPRCRAWHHETPETACWSYGARCSGCDRPTTGVAWQPEPLAPTVRRSERGSDG